MQTIAFLILYVYIQLLTLELTTTKRYSEKNYYVCLPAEVVMNAVVVYHLFVFFFESNNIHSQHLPCWIPTLVPWLKYLGRTLCPVVQVDRVPKMIT